MIQKIIVSDKRTNCYLVRDEGTGRCVLIDPGEMTDELRAVLAKAGVEKFDYILLTHCHYDHVGAAWEVKALTGAPIAIYKDDAAGLYQPLVNRTGAHGRTSVVYPPPDVLLSDGQELQVGDIRFTVLHTPGHTVGGCCYLTENAIFLGDTLFRGSYGKTNLPTGDGAQMARSLRTLAALEGDYQVYAGHGKDTTLSDERENNPYMRALTENPSAVLPL